MSFTERIDKVKNKISKLSLDGLYITNLTNVRYLTGFTGSAGSLLILDNEQHFFTDGRYIEQSKTQVKNCTIHIVGFAHYIEIAEKNILTDHMKIGIESEYVSVNLYNSLSMLMRNIQWESISGIVEEIAAIKDKLEIESLKTENKCKGARGSVTSKIEKPFPPLP